MISKINFDRLVELSNDVPEKHEQIYEDVPGFQSLRKIFQFQRFQIFENTCSFKISLTSFTTFLLKLFKVP